MQSIWYKQLFKNTFGDDSLKAKRQYKLGDMNTTIIKSEKGKTMIFQHD